MGNKKSKRITIRISPELYRILDYVSKTTGVSKSEAIRIALVNYIQILDFLRNHKRKLERLIKI